MMGFISDADFAALREQVRRGCQELQHPYPAFVLFISFSSGKERAAVRMVRGATYNAVWQAGVAAIRELAEQQTGENFWLRIDWPMAVEATTFAELHRMLAGTKRNYFRLGISFDENFEHALLEQELNANAMLYGGNHIPTAEFNEGNVRAYLQSRFPRTPLPPFGDDTPVHLFTSKGAFFDGDTLHDLYPTGRNAGRRIIDALSIPLLNSLIAAGSDFLADQVGADGRFVYGLHPCFDRTIDSHNTLRHASATYAMIEAYEVTRSQSLRNAIERSLTRMRDDYIVHTDMPDGCPAAFLVEANSEIKLGGNALAILALAKLAEVEGGGADLALMSRLAAGISFMQDAESGAFRHVLDFPSLATKDAFRTIYYEGEAAFALMRLYDLTGDRALLKAAQRAFSHFIADGYERHHDHWLAYAANELTRHCPREDYYRFAIANVASHLDFVANRITTFPTLLELMMASRQVLTRLEGDREHAHLLGDIDRRRFGAALERRALYLLNGHFWPELAMFTKNPARIAGSFFIRHHAFRVRIDDVEHYLSGLIAYRRQALEAAATVGLGQRNLAGDRDAPEDCPQAQPVG